MWGGLLNVVNFQARFYRFLMHRKFTCLISVSCRFRSLLWQSSVCKTCEQFNWMPQVGTALCVFFLDTFLTRLPPPTLTPSIPQLLSVSSVPLSFLSPSVPHSHSPSILQSFSPSFTPSLHSLLSRQFQMEFWCWLRSFITVSCGLDVGWYGVGWASNVHCTTACHVKTALFHGPRFRPCEVFYS